MYIQYIDSQVSCYVSLLNSGGVSWSSHLWGDSEHLALRDDATAWQLPVRGHEAELHQLRLSQRGWGGARRSWASRACPSNSRQEVQHVRRPATGTLRLKPQTAGQISAFHIDDEHSNLKSVDAHTFLFWIVLLSYFLYHYLRSPNCGLDVIASDFLL